MPAISQSVRGLDEFAQSQGLLLSGSLEKLKGNKLGIDGLVWLKTLGVDEPYQVAMGGMYLTLRPLITKALAAFKALDITPLFVFSGLQLVRPREAAPPRADSTAFTQAVAHGWNYIQQGDSANAKEAFRAQSSFTTEHINRIIQILQEAGASSAASACLTRLQTLNVVQVTTALCASFEPPGSNLVLLWGIDMVITQLDLAGGSYQWLGLPQILKVLGCGLDAFVDTCLLVGANPVSYSIVRDANFAGIAQMAGGVQGLLQQLANNGQIRDVNSSTQQHLRATVTVRNHAVMSIKNGVIPLSWDRCPPELHQVFGYRLPIEVFYFLSQGIVSPQVLNNVLSGYVLEMAPLADSVIYKQTVSSLIHRERAFEVHALRFCLHSAFMDKKLLVCKWFEDATELPSFGKQADVLPFMPFVFSEEDMLSNKKRLSHEVDLNLCLHWVDEDFRAATAGEKAVSNFKPVAQGDGLEFLAAGGAKADIVACYVNFSLLQTFGFLAGMPAEVPGVGARLTLTHFGTAALEFGPEYSLEAVTFLLVVKLGGINGQPLDQSDQPVRDEVRFITRALALLPMRLNGQAWDDAVDHDLIRFNSILNRIRVEWSNMAEMILLHIACRRVTPLHFGQYGEIGRTVRGPGEQACAMGIVAKYILTNDPTDKINKDTLGTIFRACEDPLADLKNACKFWTQVKSAMSVLRERVPNFPSILYEELMQADQFLTQKKQQWGI